MDKKKKKIIIIVFIFLLLTAIIWFFAFLGQSKRDSIVEKTKNLFPFGKIETGIFKKESIQEISEKQNQIYEEEPTQKKEAGPKLRLVADFPIGGFIPLIREKNKDIVDISVNSDGVKSEINRTITLKENFVRYSAIKDSTFYESYIDPYEIKQELLVENYIPNTEQVFFSKDGNNVLLQYWDIVENSPITYLAKIKKAKIEPEKCPYQFSEQIKVGDKGKKVLDLHTFLNKNPRTKIAESGINSPGNESSLAVPATITAIKNFQSLNGLDIDGKLGQATRKKMIEVCDSYQQKEAEEKFKKLKTKYETSGFFLPQGITAITISPDGNKFFYIEKDAAGVIGIVRSFIENTKKTIFESPYYGWIANWNNKDNIELTTKASYLSDGFSYHLNPNTQDYHKSFKEKKGLTTLPSPDNSKIFVHEALNKTIKNSIYNREKHTFTEIFLQTFPEKCVWAKNSINLYCAVPNSLAYGEKYPDQWYKGLESFNDSLWLINSETGKISLISSLEVDFNKKLDISKINIDDEENYLFFIDKKTEYLWSYRLIEL